MNPPKPTNKYLTLVCLFTGLVLPKLHSPTTFPKEAQHLHTSSWVCPRVSKFLHVRGTSLISTSATTRSSLLLLLVRPLPGAWSYKKRNQIKKFRRRNIFFLSNLLSNALSHVPPPPYLSFYLSANILGNTPWSFFVSEITSKENLTKMTPGSQLTWRPSLDFSITVAVYAFLWSYNYRNSMDQNLQSPKGKLKGRVMTLYNSIS